MLIFFASLLAVATAEFAEDDFLSFTARKSLISRHEGNFSAFAWVETTRGTDNVVGCIYHRDESCKPEKLTSYADADGIVIGWRWPLT